MRSLPKLRTTVYAVMLSLLIVPGLSTAGRIKHVVELELQQSLQIETGWARSFIQGGQPVLRRDIDKFETYCSIEGKTVAQPGMTIRIEPDLFRITRIRHSHIVGGIFGGILNHDEDVGPVESEVDIYLQSLKQPDVIRIRCVKWEPEAIHAKPVSLGEVRATLGSVAAIR